MSPSQGEPAFRGLDAAQKLIFEVVLVVAIIILQLCVSCIKCHGCGSPAVTNWISVTNKEGVESFFKVPLQEIIPDSIPFCDRCLELRNSKNFCPICHGCYEDDDFDSKMMECGKCKEWVHANCEGLTDEWYQILSFLPDSVEFVCKLCLKDEKSLWMDAINKELQEGMQFIINLLSGSKCAKHLIRIENKALLSKKSDPNCSNYTQNSKLIKEKETDDKRDACLMDNAHVMILESDPRSNEIISQSCITLPVNGNCSLLSNDGIDSADIRNTEQMNSELHVPLTENSPGNQTIEIRATSKTMLPPIQNFERPQTRSYKASSTKDDLNNKEEIMVIVTGSEDRTSITCDKDNSNLSPYAGEDVSLKKCIVRLEDICKTAKTLNEYSSPSGSPFYDCENSDNGMQFADGSAKLSRDYKILHSEGENIIEQSSESCSASKIESTLTSGVGSLLTPKKTFKQGSSSDFDEDDRDVKKKDKNSPYSVVAKVSKDIDDDCLSSEESSFCSSDTEIESIFEDPDEIKDLQDVRVKVNEEKYKSLLYFHVDVMRVLEAGRNLNKAQTRNTKATYAKHMKERFPWFNVHHPNIFSLIDCSHPFPFPYSDHNYSDIKFSERAGSSLSWKRSLLNGIQVSHFKRQNYSPRIPSSPLRWQKSSLSSQADQRKCLLCNLNGDADPWGAGRLLYLGQDEWLHVNCGLWSSEVYEEEDGGLQNVYVAVSRGKQIKCSICLERGATVGCCHKSCQATYHFMCAKNSGCFFGEDKRIFCKSHILTDDSLKPIEDLRVGRCVFVNMDSEKRRWRQAATSKVNVIIGSLYITSLGKMVPDIDFEDALIPTEFMCTRMFWSTKNPTKRVKYFCRTRIVRPSSVSGSCKSSFHKTINHSMDGSIVEKEMAEVKAWQKEVERQKWARQSRHTNIIPPQMCPLYREILHHEKKSLLNSLPKKSAPLPTRRHLFSPFPSANEYDDDDEEVVRLCVEELLDHISQTSTGEFSFDPKTISETSILPPPTCRWDDTGDIVPLPGPDDKSCTSPAPPTDENSEIMTSIVNSDDNEIISMVLKDLAAFESSALQSTPSTSGRLSPLDLDFLAVCDPGINPEEKLNDDDTFDSQQQKLSFKSVGEVPFEVEGETKTQVAKSFLEDDGAEARLICQKLFEACDSQMQNHILTLEQNQTESSCTAADISSNIKLTNPIDPPVVYSHEPIKSDSLATAFKQNYTTVNSDVSHSDIVSHQAMHHPSFHSFPGLHHPTNSFFSEKDEASHSGVEECHSQRDKVTGCSSDDFKDFFMETNSKISVVDQNHSRTLESSVFLDSETVSNCEPPDVGQQSWPLHQATASLEELSEERERTPFSHQNSLLNGLKHEPETHPLPSSQEPLPTSTLNLEPSISNPPFSVSSNSSFPNNSSCPSTRKQVCRVLPMLSTSVSSRRNSSASDQSEAGPVPSAEVQSSGDTETQNERLCPATEAPSATESVEKKRKIHMKRNYRTVIKKYPLRSAFRKHTPYKTVQIEINETIEIPSEDDEQTVCRQSLKRKWSSEVISDKEDGPSDKGGIKSCSRRGKRKVFQSSEAGTSKKDEQLDKADLLDNETQKEDNSKIASRPTAARSHRVLKFSDDHNAITVSIVNNNNLCNFSQRKRRHRYRRKTVLQLDGAADDSSSEETNVASDDSELALSSDLALKQQQPLHSDLALHIKQQSLARSSPGEEGPYKCSKCKRLYRTKDSYKRHIETCTFEIDSSTSSEEEVDRLVENKEKRESDEIVTINSCERRVTKEDITVISATSNDELNSMEEESGCLSSDSQVVTSSLQTNSKSDATNLEKLEELCTSPARLEGSSLCAEMLKGEKDEPGIERTPAGLHRQVRIAMRRSSDVKSTSSDESASTITTTSAQVSSLGGPEVFVPPTHSPIKFNPTVKKSASPRRYTNVRLFKGRQGYQYRRAPPQLNSQSQQPQQTTFPQTPSQRPPLTQSQPPLTHFQPTQQQPQASSIPLAIQSLVDQGPYRVQTPAYPSTPQYQGPLNSSLSQVNRDLGGGVGPIAQVMTVVSGPSVAVPQGYTLQYVGSFRDGDIATPAANLLTYQTPQPMVMPSTMVMTPQPAPVVMPQVMNTNITYTIATPETLVINQPTAVVPSVHYVTPQPQPQTQQQPQAFQSSVIQSLGAVMSFNQPQVSSLHSIGSPIAQHTLPLSSMTVPQPSPQDNSPMDLLPTASFGNPPPPSYLPSSASTTSLQTCPPSPRSRPQAFIAPISSEASKEPRCLKIEPCASTVSRPLFAQTPPVIRSVATVAPAVFTTSSAPAVARATTCGSALPLVTPSTANSTNSAPTLPKESFDIVCSVGEISPRVVATIRPRPTYSYRDAMKGSQSDKKRLRPDDLPSEIDSQPPPLKKKDAKEEEDSDDSEREELKEGEVDEPKVEGRDVQSYKLVLRKDGQSGSSRFNMLPLSGPNVPFPSPEVKELRIKAKVSVGPKRKNTSVGTPRNQWGSQTGKEFIFASKDTTNDLLVNEQTPNVSLNVSPSQASSLDDPSLIDKPKTSTTEPYIVFELTSEDGFKVESRHVSEVWQKVLDAVSEARDNLRFGVKGGDSGAAGLVGTSEAKGKNLSGLHMLGLTHNAVQYLLEQLPGAKDCHKYSFQFHRRPSEDDHLESASGCARSEAFKTRSPYDVFSWLASKHRRLPYKARIQQEEIQLSTRRATSLELPMAMRYRHLCETAREAVGVFRSNIHGRGLFCKREIDAGEMVIEYAGQVIRSSLCDMREKFYESKGIGCYMFRIDEETVIDATMHGNAARFINHSCDPNCYSRVVDILGKKHIIIFALRRIQRGEELTYDYKFPIEDDKIPCSCGARRCRKYLN